MILKFPDLETLKLVLVNGVVPPSVCLAPATAGGDDKGPLWIETSSTVPKKTLDELKKFGVEKATKSGAELVVEISCWPEMLPLVPENTSVLPEQTPVLFDLPDGEQFKWMANEILRLGNDRQSYRWLQDKEGSTRALLRVIGPPYYSLLRAIDATGPHSPRAFVERGNRVWVQVGWSHPLVKNLKAPDGQLLLLLPPRQWTYLPEQPLEDLYKVIDFKLPGLAPEYEDRELKDRLKVSLKLTPGNATEPAELWVLRDDPMAELNTLVQASSDELLARLSFAVGESKGRTIIAMLVRPSKQTPPVLTLKATAYRNYWKLPNLYLPVGWSLHPPLRRDIVRQLLAENTDLLTWLHPEDNAGRFTPERMSREAFRPLSEWVDYVLDREAETLQTWVQSHRFEFESFVCGEEGPPKPKKGPPPEKVRNASRGGSFQPVEAASKDDEEANKTLALKALDDVPLLIPLEPSAQQVRLAELVEAFVALEGSLDTPERVAMWPELARLNSALNNTDDAGICWTNALWNSDAWPQSYLWEWFRTEASKVSARQEKGKRAPTTWVTAVLTAEKPREVSGEDLDRVLAASPTLTDMRALSAYLVWASRCDPTPSAIASRLNVLGRFVERHEDLLSARATWLTWLAFLRLTKGDVLALARARDRLLHRFYEAGLRPEHDLPHFLRQSGTTGTQRFRNVRDWMLGLCDLVCEWSRSANMSTASDAVSANTGTVPTLAYIQLLFAYGLARLGEIDASNELIDRARKTLEPGIQGLEALDQLAHRFLQDAFHYRIRQAQERRPNTGPLPASLMDQLKKLEKPIKKDADAANSKLSLAFYSTTRLRQHLKVLEPEEKIDPYAPWESKRDELSSQLSDIIKLSDRREIGERLLKLYQSASSHKAPVFQRFRILVTSMNVAPRVHEEFANEVLNFLGDVWEALPDSFETIPFDQRADLLERSLFVAVHFDRRSHVPVLVSRFRQLLQRQQGDPKMLEAVEKLGRESLRGLRKLGMRDEIDQLLHQLENVILEGREPMALATLQPGQNGPMGLKALLHVASGWLYFNRDRQAEPTVRAARTLLYSHDWDPKQKKDRATLAAVYARTIGGSSVEVMKSELEELFKRLEGISDGWTTARFYGLMQLDLVESVVLAIVGDDQALGREARRWLDDDEFIVRRRIHRDYQAAKG